MLKQLHDWRVLVDAMFARVWEYIDAQDYWGAGTKLWVDVQIGSVVLAEADEVRSGDRTPVDRFIRISDSGKREPDGDYIEEYAYQWFDFRTGD